MLKLKLNNTLGTWCEELTHWKRPWCWERLGAGGKGSNRGWEGWMASSTQWTWVWVNAGRWWWTGRPGMLQSMESQRVGHDWATALNWILIIFREWSQVPLVPPLLHQADGWVGRWMWPQHVTITLLWTILFFHRVVNSTHLSQFYRTSLWWFVCSQHFEH